MCRESFSLHDKYDRAEMCAHAVCSSCCRSLVLRIYTSSSAHYRKQYHIMGWRPFLMCGPYLLGLLAMIKCSICSYQCDNWYVSNWRLACHMNVSLGSCCPELAQALSSVALAWHRARGSTPFGVTHCGLGSRSVHALKSRVRRRGLHFSLLFVRRVAANFCAHTREYTRPKVSTALKGCDTAIVWQTYLASAGRRSSSLLS